MARQVFSNDVGNQGDGRLSADADTALSSASPMEPASGLHPDGLQSAGAIECHGLDTPERVCFYEQDFYVLSNFSAFAVEWSGFVFPTSEHLYHWLRFTLSEDSFGPEIASRIFCARSAHDAFKIAQAEKRFQVANWDAVKVGFMRRVIRAKAEQHKYIMRKLLATGERELVENSWRDDFWGWGPNRDGQNMLGKLWMEARAELRAASADTRRMAETALAGSGRSPSGAVGEAETPTPPPESHP